MARAPPLFPLWPLIPSCYLTIAQFIHLHIDTYLELFQFLTVATNKTTINSLLKPLYNPGWCGSVEWVQACEPKGHHFDSQCRSHVQVVGWVPSGGCVRGKHTLMFLSLSSLSLSLPLSLKNKIKYSLCAGICFYCSQVNTWE